jgi:2-hydroxychromene-2-carboxylate isomerase
MTAPKPATGTASRSNPSWLERRLTSLVIRNMASPARRDAARRRAERKRRGRGEPHRLEYFHQVDDPYSHLAAQLLSRLAAAYDIEIAAQLVGPTDTLNAPEPELLAAYARKDAADVAPHYGLAFPRGAGAPPPEAIDLGQRILAAADAGDFAERACAVGEALWSDDGHRLAELAGRWEPADAAGARQRIAAGTNRREKLGHYSGAMFHYAGEWYWGVDRLVHLEQRLEALGAARAGSARPVAPRPALDPGPVRDTGRISLDFFPSLRSPYTAISMDATLALAERSGVKLVLRPVLPMVMRGVPLSFAKGRYIFRDVQREAELAGVPFGKFVDPIGRPVERAFSLFPWAQEQGRGAALLAEFVRAAFADGVDTSRDAGLRHVVERAGLAWTDALREIDGESWRDEVERNRLVMCDDVGLWGVPSFRVRGPEGAPDFATWGNDRLWLVAAKIHERISGTAAGQRDRASV